MPFPNVFMSQELQAKELIEFDRRIELLSAKKPISKWSLSDLATIIRTHEAMERTKMARVRTRLSWITIGLGSIGLVLLYIRVFTLV